ncbi:MAG: GMC family oxidoreductase [Leptolyngbya sp. SIO1E4]|nr:GMC family oxidoreductase [Leptolyngbya sp. SIO1E4]
MHIYTAPEPYDAIVVGSGATGGVAAKALGQQGLKVLVLEAGRDVDPQRDVGHPARNLLQRAYNLISRRQTYQAAHPGYWKTNPTFFVDEQENPYTTPEHKPFYWVRGRQVGGRSHTWGGITLRLSDYEFKAAQQDGYGDNWPIAYADLAPYYDQLERFFQVRGAQDGLSQLPDGQYLPPSPLTPAEHTLREVVEATWPQRRLIHSRGFSLHSPSPEQPWSRAASPGSSLKAALATGNVVLQPNAVVSHLCFDPDSHTARGVAFVDRLHKTAHEVRGRIIVLCASAIESVRILLHSTETYQPHGLTNESGVLGRHLMDHVSTTQFFRVPGVPESSETFPLSGSESFFIPRFCNLTGSQESFLRGYGLWGGIQRFSVPSVLRKGEAGAIGFLIGHGEVLPRPENRVSLSLETVDAWGIPAAHIDCAWSDNEHQMVAHMRQQIQATVEAVGGNCLSLTELFHMPLVAGWVRHLEKTLTPAAPPGYYIHEVGGARMGTTPNTSVVNVDNQCWEALNVLVTDGACWVSSGWQSPTLTEMAITARACDRIAEKLRRGDV